jgi:hypothetical protein
VCYTFHAPLGHLRRYSQKRAEINTFTSVKDVHPDRPIIMQSHAWNKAQ